MINRIVLIGAGNVASNLGKAFLKAGKEILQVYSRTEEAASELARDLNCSYTTDLGKLKDGADIYIVSVTDSAIKQIVESFPFDGVLVAHTSGSTDISVLRKKKIRPSVLYPLQTFSKDVEVNFKEVSFLLEAAHKDDIEPLKKLAELISDKAYLVDSKQRMITHISAVFACNFINHMFYIAGDILKQHELDFEMLKPLIRETIRKAELVGPYKAQTGPAVRNDKLILKLHSEMLAPFGNYQKFYNFISASIVEKHKKLDD